VRELREKNTSSNTGVTSNINNDADGGIMFIGGLVFAAVITAYAYNGDTNIFTFIGVGITLAGLVRLWLVSQISY
jgi:hypothetical protein